MRAKPSPGGKSKRPGLARSATQSRGSRPKRHRRLQVCQDPQKTDSTIATVTLFIGGGETGENVRVVQNTTASGTVPGDKFAAGGDELDLDSSGLESEESQQKCKPRHLPEIESKAKSPSPPKQGKVKRKSKERYPSGKPHVPNDSSLAVFDLDDRTNLPTEVIDLLSCQGGEFCFHEHDRCRVVNNKLYVCTKRKRHEKKRHMSESRQSPPQPKRTKKVTFSPDHKPRRRSKRGKTDQESVNSVPESNQEEDEQSVPPPPRGYHIRIVPSSPDACKENFANDDSMWTEADADTVSELTRNYSGSSKSSQSRSRHKQHLPIKEMKERFKRAMGTTPRRRARSSRSKTKKKMPGSYGKTDKKPNDENGSCGAFGDSVWEADLSQLDVQNASRGKYDSVEGHGCLHMENNSDQGDIFISRHIVKPGVVRNHSNKTRLKHTHRQGKDVDLNNNSHIFLSTDSIAPPISYSSNFYNIVHFLDTLNMNMNALSNNGNVDEDVPGDQVTIPEHNQIPSTPGVDQLNTPDLSSPSQQPVVMNESNLEKCPSELCQQKVEVDMPEAESSSESVASVKEKIPEVNSQIESDQECWEAKKHSIMMACNEAIKNRLQRQELEEDVSQETMSSDSTTAKHSRETRKKRKTKTTESVYLKFKTSMSKKMTTTTTVKEIKQSSCGFTAKTMMLENDQHSALSLTSQSSEQSLSVPQPRHTRIVKCGELENTIRKRKLSSDTEVEQMHTNDSSKQLSGHSKSANDNVVRDRPISRKENTYVETSLTEEHSLDVDRHDASQQSPQQNQSVGHGEMIGECDKLSEKASAITVISALETPNAALNSDKPQRSEVAELEDSESSQTEGHELIQSACLSLDYQSGSTTAQECANKKITNKRIKPQSRQSSKKKSGPKLQTSKTLNNTEPSTKFESPQGPQSETSLSQMSKKGTFTSSTSKAVILGMRSHSSPPDYRKKKNLKKKTGAHLLEPSEAGSKCSYKKRKRSPDKKRKLRAITLKEKRPRKTVSNSSTNSDKRRKSQTTVSSISIESIEGDHDAKEKTLSGNKRGVSEIEVTLPSVGVEEVELSKISESPQVSSFQKETLSAEYDQIAKMAAQNCKHQKTEVKTVEQNEVKEDGVLETDSHERDDKIIKQTPELKRRPECDAPAASKLSSRVSSRMSNPRTFPRNRSKEKDLQKAEMGWNNSIFYSGEDKAKTTGTKAKCVNRRPKLKYVLVKAKDKTKEKTENKTEPKLINGEAEIPHEETSDQNMKQDGQGDSSLRTQAKTVQFSESIDKIETLKQADLQDEIESTDQPAQETHIGDNASDGSLGDMFLTNNFDLVRELVELEEESKKEQAETILALEEEAILESEKQKSISKRFKRPVWLKKAAPKPLDEPIIAETRTVMLKQSSSPNRSEKRKESFDDVLLKSKKCNIQVTNPLPPSGLSPKVEHASAKTKVAYSSMLSSVFLSLPLKRGARRVIAETGSPVDIKEVIEGSSVDAADYAKSLRYSPKTRRPSLLVSAGTGRRKGSIEPRAWSPKEMPTESGSVRSFVSRDSETDRRPATPNCSFSTDLDEVPGYRPTQSNPGNRSLKVARKKEKRVISGHRASSVLPWHLVSGGSDQVEDTSFPYHEGTDRTGLSCVRVAGEMIEAGILNLGLSWLMHEFFNRFDFLNPRRHLRTAPHRQASDFNLDGSGQEQQTIGTV